MITCITHRLGPEWICADCGYEIYGTDLKSVIVSGEIKQFFEGDLIGVIHSPLTGRAIYKAGKHDSNKRCIELMAKGYLQACK